MDSTKSKGNEATQVPPLETFPVRKPEESPTSAYGPVGLEKLFEAFHAVERRIKGELSRAIREKYMIGLRVAYGVANDDQPPDSMSYKIEVGNLEQIDYLRCCAPELDKRIDEPIIEGLPLNPVTSDTIIQIHQETKDVLQRAAGMALHVQVDVVMYGGHLRSMGVACCLNNQSGADQLRITTSHPPGSYCTAGTC